MAEEGNLASVIAPDLGKQRGLSKATLDLFNVSVNGTGWYWKTKVKGGGSATRWKSFYSTREAAPEAVQKGWSKYLWLPERPEGADYFCAPSVSLTGLIKANGGELWLVGGEIAAMSMIEAGLTNTTSFFGDNMIPVNLAADLAEMDVRYLFMIPDRDESGQKCAYEVRDRLRETDIEFRCYMLPYPLADKHGKDVNDLWLECKGDKDCFTRKALAMELWVLPERKEETPIVFPDVSSDPDTDLPREFIRDIERALEIYPVFNSEGWSRKNVRCPFHDDEHGSANWNGHKHILKCFVCEPVGRSYYLAKEVGDRFGLDLSRYNHVPSAPPLKLLPKVTGEAPKVEPIKPEPNRLRPPLPETVELAADQVALAKTGRRWLDTYVKYASDAASATPEIFHEAMGLWLLATAATRRVKLQVGGLEIYPNLYIMIIARTSVYCKSTGMAKAAGVLAKANLDVLRLPAETTPEALFDELAGIKPINFDKLPQDVQRRWMLGRAFAGQRAIMKDEASSILANLKKEYMGGLSELLLQGYDSHSGSTDKRVQSRGLISIKDLSLCFLGATTPIMWSKYVGNEENENGLTPRMAIITPEGAPEQRDAPDVVEMPQALVDDVRRMFLETLPGDYRNISPMMNEIASPPITTASIDPKALAHLKAYHKALRLDIPAAEKIDESKTAPYSRLGTMSYKIALLLATIESHVQTIRVEERHAYAAHLICERWRESLHRLDLLINKAKNTNGHDKLLQYIQSFNGEGATLRDIMRDMNIPTRAAALDKLQVLAEDGKVERFDRRPEGRGRPSICYRAIQE